MVGEGFDIVREAVGDASCAKNPPSQGRIVVGHNARSLYRVRDVKCAGTAPGVPFSIARHEGGCQRNIGLLSPVSVKEVFLYPDIFKPKSSDIHNLQLHLT